MKKIKRHRPTLRDRLASSRWRRLRTTRANGGFAENIHPLPGELQDVTEEAAAPRDVVVAFREVETIRRQNPAVRAGGSAKRGAQLVRKAWEKSDAVGALVPLVPVARSSLRIEVAKQL